MSSSGQKPFCLHSSVPLSLTSPCPQKISLRSLRSFSGLCWSRIPRGIIRCPYSFGPLWDLKGRVYPVIWSISRVACLKYAFAILSFASSMSFARMILSQTLLHSKVNRVAGATGLEWLISRISRNEQIRLDLITFQGLLNMNVDLLFLNYFIRSNTTLQFLYSFT